VKISFTALIICIAATQAWSSDLYAERRGLCAASNVDRWGSARTHLFGNTFGNRDFLCQTTIQVAEQNIPEGQALLDGAKCERLRGAGKGQKWESLVAVQRVNKNTIVLAMVKTEPVFRVELKRCK